jgi:hypothetical protein
MGTARQHPTFESALGRIRQASFFTRTLIATAFWLVIGGFGLSAWWLVASALNEPMANKQPDTTVRAFAWKSSTLGGERRGFFIVVREKEQTFDGKRIRLFCVEDGTGEVVIETNGTFVAANGAARDRVKNFWVVQGRQLVRVVDSGFPNDMPSRLEFLELHMSTIINAGVEMCPLRSPALETAYRAVVSAIGNYAANARRLEVSIP